MGTDGCVKVICNNCSNTVLSRDFCPVCNNDLSINANYTKRKKFTALKIICFVLTLLVSVVWMVSAWNNTCSMRQRFLPVPTLPGLSAPPPIFDLVCQWGVFKIEHLWLSVLLHALIVAVVYVAEWALFYVLESKQKKKYVRLPSLYGNK